MCNSIFLFDHLYDGLIVFTRVTSPGRLVLVSVTAFHFVRRNFWASPKAWRIGRRAAFQENLTKSQPKAEGKTNSSDYKTKPAVNLEEAEQRKWSVGCSVWSLIRDQTELYTLIQVKVRTIWDHIDLEQKWQTPHS